MSITKSGQEPEVMQIRTLYLAATVRNSNPPQNAYPLGQKDRHSAHHHRPEPLRGAYPTGRRLRGGSSERTPTGAGQGQPPGHYGLMAAWPRCQGRNEVESAAALDQWGCRNSLSRRWPGLHGRTYLPRECCLSRAAADGSEEAARLPWASGGQRGWLHREITGPRLGQSRGCPNETVS